MAEYLNPLQYGTVVGRFLVLLGDSDDTDLQPDAYPAKGYLTFTPATSYANVKSAQPDPATVFPQKVYAVLDAQGYLNSVKVDAIGNPLRAINGEFIPEQRGIRIQASSDPNILPTNWTWRVTFNLHFNDTQLNYEAFDFTLEPNQTVDLAYVKPTKTSPGVITITGPRGLTGDTGPKGDTGPVNTLSIGTVSTVATGGSATASVTGDAPDQKLNLGLPRGPVGPSGGPMPPGGSDGQLVRKMSGGVEWFTPTYATTSDVTSATNEATEAKNLATSNSTSISSINSTLSGRTALNTPNALVMRDSSGRAYFSRVYAESTPVAGTELTNKSYVDSSISSAVSGRYNYNMGSIKTANLNDIGSGFLVGEHYVSGSSTGAPVLAGFKFNGFLRGYTYSSGDYRQELYPINVHTRGPGFTSTYDENMSQGYYFTRTYSYGSWSPWKMLGMTDELTINTTPMINFNSTYITSYNNAYFWIENGSLRFDGQLGASLVSGEYSIGTVAASGLRPRATARWYSGVSGERPVIIHVQAGGNILMNVGSNTGTTQTLNGLTWPIGVS